MKLKKLYVGNYFACVYMCLTVCITALVGCWYCVFFYRVFIYMVYLFRKVRTLVFRL